MGLFEISIAILVAHIIGSVSFFIVAILDEELQKNTVSLLMIGALSLVWEPVVLAYFLSKN